MWASPTTNIRPWMRPAYITLSTLLGVLLSYLGHALLESWYLQYAEKRGMIVEWYTHFGSASCALPPLLQYTLLGLGVVGGFLLGRWWWQVLYVERRWNINAKNNDRRKK